MEISQVQQTRRNTLPTTSTMVSIAVSIAIACIGAGLLIGKKTIAGSVLAGVGSVAFGLTAWSAQQAVFEQKMRSELRTFLTSLRDEFKGKTIELKFEPFTLRIEPDYVTGIKASLEKIKNLTDQEIEAIVRTADLKDIVLLSTLGKTNAQHIQGIARIFGDNPEKFDHGDLRYAIMNSRARNRLVLNCSKG